MAGVGRSLVPVGLILLAQQLLFPAPGGIVARGPPAEIPPDYPSPAVG